MAVSVQMRNGRAQLRVTSPLLPRPFFHTFDTELEARKYGKQLAELLARGIVPVELQQRAPAAADPLLVQIIRGYCKAAPVAPSDEALLGAHLALQPWRRGRARLDQRVVCAGGSRRGNGLHDGVSS